jgi:hypothetical protein
MTCASGTAYPCWPSASCSPGAANDPEASDDHSTEEAATTGGTEAAGTDDAAPGEDASTDEALAAPELTEMPSLEDLGVSVSDDEVRGLGLVLPLPAGWELGRIDASQGALFASSGGMEPEQLLCARAGIESDPGFEELGSEDADGTLALFQYLAASGSEGAAVIHQVLEQGGFDPDSDPLGASAP